MKTFSLLFSLSFLILCNALQAQHRITTPPCNPCSGKIIRFGQPKGSSFISYLNDGSLSISGSVTFIPTKLIKVAAQVVDVQRFGEAGCLACTKESKNFGNYTGGSLNSNAGNIANGDNGYGKQIQWQFTAPTLVNNFSYALQMMFPPLTEATCCGDSLHVCIRWSFTDTNCITCDTLLCTTIIRQFQKTGPILHNGGSTGIIGPRIANMGEPYISWYNQESNELPPDFTVQVKKLFQKREDKLESDRFEDFDTSMMAAFATIRNIKMTGTDGIWAAIQNNPLNDMCDGIDDFEDGLIHASQWSGGYGTIYGVTNDPSFGLFQSGFAPVITSTINTPISNGAGCLNYLPLPSSTNNLADYLTNQADQTHHTLVNFGNDPSVGSLLQTTSSPTGNAYSFRLGNSCPRYGCEYISKKFVVTNSGIVKFMYALVLETPVGHSPTTHPSFWVKVYSNTGNLISGVTNLGSGFIDKIYSSTDPFFQQGPLDIVYRDWTCATINLSQYIGQTVSVALITTDCSAGAHWGYAYIDDWCGNCAGSSTGSVIINAIPDSCIKPGTKVCVDYTLPKIGTTTGNGTISLQFYQNGIPFPYNMTSPSLTTNGTYCFTIDPTQLPCIQGQTGYDVVATGNFGITVGSTTTPITVTSPDPIGNPIQGIKPGMNNDLVCCGTPADNCCMDFVKTVNAQVSMVGNATAGYNTIKFVPTFTAGPKLIKQIRISVVNFESHSSNKECLTCENSTSKYGTMSVPQSLIGSGGKDPIEGMAYPSQPMIATCLTCPPLWSHLPSHEVTWGSESGIGYNLMDGVGDQSTTFFVHLPKKSTLSCCEDTIKVCIKYSFTDIDCKTCDTIICYKVVNRQTISQSATRNQDKGKMEKTPPAIQRKD